MRAATYCGNRTFALEDRPPAPATAGHVRLDVAFTGICGTDLHVFHGDMDARVAPPAVLGHEASARVAEVGDGVAEWKPGDPVTVMPLVSCGACAACSAGHAHICQRLVFVGLDSSGSMQESWTVPAELLVRLPDDMPMEHGALIEPTAVAVHDVARAGVDAGERVLVVGGGPVGLLIAAVARASGADVLVSEPAAARRAVADAIGLKSIDPASGSLLSLVEDWSAGAGVDVAFEASGSAPGLDAAVHALAVRGRLVVVGIHPRPVPVDLFRVFWRELTLIGARVYERADFERAVELVYDGAVPAEALITRIDPLNATARAFEALEAGDVMKVLLDCRPV